MEHIIESFAALDFEDRLEVLVDYARRLEPLSAAYAQLRDQGLFIVSECQAPVFFMVELVDGVVHIEADAPEEAVIARGFTALLKSAFDRAERHQLKDAPRDLLSALGIEELLGAQRRRGLSAIYGRLLSVRHL